MTDEPTLAVRKTGAQALAMEPKQFRRSWEKLPISRQDLIEYLRWALGRKTAQTHTGVPPDKLEGAYQRLYDLLAFWPREIQQEEVRAILGLHPEAVSALSPVFVRRLHQWVGAWGMEHLEEWGEYGGARLKQLYGEHYPHSSGGSFQRGLRMLRSAAVGAGKLARRKTLWPEAWTEQALAWVWEDFPAATDPSGLQTGPTIRAWVVVDEVLWSMRWLDRTRLIELYRHLMKRQNRPVVELLLDHPASGEDIWRQVLREIPGSPQFFEALSASSSFCRFFPFWARWEEVLPTLTPDTIQQLAQHNQAREGVLLKMFERLADTHPPGAARLFEVAGERIMGRVGRKDLHVVLAHGSPQMRQKVLREVGRERERPWEKEET